MLKLGQYCYLTLRYAKKKTCFLWLQERERGLGCQFSDAHKVLPAQLLDTQARHRKRQPDTKLL